MFEWSVKGLGTRIIVTSPIGDEYPFAITSVDELRLELCTAPRWGSGREPDDAATRIDRAHTMASRWAADTFGP